MTTTEPNDAAVVTAAVAINQNMHITETNGRSRALTIWATTTTAILAYISQSLFSL